MRIEKFVIYAIGLGLFLRILGIWYGLPLALSIDEPALVSTVLSLKMDLLPNQFAWPHLYFYFNAVFYGIYVLVKNIYGHFFLLPKFVFTPAPFFLISRMLSVTFGTLTIYSIYLLTKMIYNKKVAVLAAFITAILPIHVFESHLAKTDIVQTFVTSVTLLFIYKILKFGRQKDYIIAGILIGISTSIKYGGALMFFPLLIAHLYSLKELSIKNLFNKNFNKKIFISGVVSVVTFFIGTPNALFSYNKFFSNERAVGALWQIKNVGSVTWAQYPIELFSTFFEMYRENIVGILWIMFIALMLHFILFNRRDKKTVFLLLPTVVFSFYITKFDRSPDHYFLFLIPFYVPVLAKFIFEVWKYFKFRLPSRYRSYETIFFIIILVPSFFISFKSSFLMARKDTRNLAYNWVKSNLNEKKDFLYVVGEELEKIPFQKDNTLRIKKIDRSAITDSSTFYIVLGEYGVTKDSLITKNRDPDNLDGNSAPILKDSEIVFSASNKFRLGPPIYIIHVKYKEVFN